MNHLPRLSVVRPWTAWWGTMAGRETGDLDIKIGHLNDRGYSVRPSHLQLTVRWPILARLGRGARCGGHQLDHHGEEAGSRRWRSAGVTAIATITSGYDGSRVTVVRDNMTGKTTIYWTHPPTAMGRLLCLVAIIRRRPHYPGGARVGGDTQRAPAHCRIPPPTDDHAAIDDRGGRHRYRSRADHQRDEDYRAVRPPRIAMATDPHLPRRSPDLGLSAGIRSHAIHRSRKEFLSSANSESYQLATIATKKTRNRGRNELNVCHSGCNALLSFIVAFFCFDNDVNS